MRKKEYLCNMKQLILFFLLGLAALGSVWAQQVGPTYNMSVWGTMGESTKFTLDLVLSGTNPGIVEGTTIYEHKNGTRSHIEVEGVIKPVNDGKTDEPASYHLQLRENVRGKVCGNFDFDVPARAISEEAGLPVAGRWWMGQKELPFADVKVNGFSYYGEEEEENDIDIRQHSGTYGYCYASAADKTKRNEVLLSMLMGTDSTYFAFTYNVEEKEFSLQFRSDKGYGNDPKQPRDCWTFHLGNVKYNVSTTGGTLCIWRANQLQKGSNGLPKGVEIEGFYPRLTCFASAEAERKEGTAVLSSSQTIEVPVVEYPANTYVNQWLHNEIGYNGKDPFWLAAETTAENGLEGLDVWEDMEDWQAPWVSDDVTCETFNLSANYLNMSRGGTRYMGGAHGMPYRYTVTLDRKTGDMMKWTDWFKNPDDIAAMVGKAMKEQNDEVEFYLDELGLPIQDPWYSDGEMLFMYQFYEAAPYSCGTPMCAIPIKALLPYMTEHGKKVAK